MENLTPKQIVSELDKYIVGQQDAKRAVAIALRNRYRRSLLDESLREDVTPKNIIMIGPTGVGKTEIARRLSKIVQAPFVKVEATKFTEVGYVGKDVESMVRDLVEASIRMVKKQRTAAVRERAAALAEQRLADILMGEGASRRGENPFQMLFNPMLPPGKPSETPEEKEKKTTKREEVLAGLQSGAFENVIVEVEVEDNSGVGIEIAGIGSEINMGEMFSGILPKKTKTRKVPVSEARKILEEEEAEELIDMDEVVATAIENAEQSGIIFFDEIDKIAGKSKGVGPDISREGVQRDILPIVEGSVVTTKYGPVKTDHMLFIAAGAFNVSKVSDLIPELQGRFPIQVDLKPLLKEDFVKILTQPQNSLIKQYTALLEADGIRLSFSEEAIEAMAGYAYEANSTMENIGARRLHTIVENLLEDISFNAGNVFPPVDVKIDKKYVDEHMKDYLKDRDLSRFVL